MHRSALRGLNQFNASPHCLRSILCATQLAQRFTFKSVRLLAAVVGKAFGQTRVLKAPRAPITSRSNRSLRLLGLSNATRLPTTFVGVMFCRTPKLDQACQQKE